MNTTSIIQHLLKSAPGSLENHTPSSVPRPRPLRSGTGQNNSLGDRTKGILGGMVLAALLAFIGTTAVGQTHPFQTSASGIAQFLYDTNVPTSTLLVTQQSEIKGFSRDATVAPRPTRGSVSIIRGRLRSRVEPAASMARQARLTLKLSSTVLSTRCLSRRRTRCRWISRTWAPTRCRSRRLIHESPSRRRSGSGGADDL